MAISYPDLSNLSQNATIADFVALPNSSYPFFWAWIMAGLWLIITFTLYFKEQEKIGKSRMLSSMAVSSFATITLSIIGSLFGIITNNILTYIIVFCFMIIIIWIFSK